MSESDCLNLTGSIFSLLDESIGQKDYRFLFPKNFEGKRFDQFSKMYFQNKVTSNQVTFSDELYELTRKPLNGLSGVVLVYEDQLLSAVALQNLAIEKIKIDHYIRGLSKATNLINFQEEGISNRYNLTSEYSASNLALFDVIYRTLYFWDTDKSLTTIDLKDDIFQKLLQQNLSKQAYQQHLERKVTLEKVGKYFPEPYNLILNNKQLSLFYYIPYATADPEDPKHTFIKAIRNLAIIPTTKSKLTAQQILENSYVERQSETDIEFIPTNSAAAYKGDYYKINQLQYTEKDWSTQRTFPLLSKLEQSITKGKKESQFSPYDAIQNFSFQQDTILNKTYIMSIEFSSVNQHILLKDHPYAVDIEKKEKYTLDWEENLNKYYYPANIIYEQLQFWETPHGFTVLVRKDQHYYLKTYSSDWKLQKEKVLPFLTDKIFNLNFTKDHVYLITDNNIVRIPNIFEL